MSFQAFQLAHLGFYACLAIIFWKVRRKNIRILIAILAITIFAFNPVRFKQKGVVQLERGGPVFKVEERWTDPTKTFKQRQAEELSQLKEESDNVSTD